MLSSSPVRLAGARDIRLCLCVAGCQLGKQSNRLGAPLRVDTIVNPFSLFPSNYNAGITKNPHVMGKSRLSDVKFFQ